MAIEDEESIRPTTLDRLMDRLAEQQLRLREHVRFMMNHTLYYENRYVKNVTFGRMACNGAGRDGSRCERPFEICRDEPAEGLGRYKKFTGRN